MGRKGSLETFTQLQRRGCHHIAVRFAQFHGSVGGEHARALVECHTAGIEHIGPVDDPYAAFRGCESLVRGS